MGQPALAEGGQLGPRIVNKYWALVNIIARIVMEQKFRGIIIRNKTLMGRCFIGWFYALSLQ